MMSRLVKWLTSRQMNTRGHTKHPCTQSSRFHGLSVGHIQRYRCVCMRPQGEPSWRTIKSQFYIVPNLSASWQS